MVTTPAVHCPAVYVPNVELATEAELAPILEHLERTQEPTSRTFPKGTIARDGRLDLCKQGLGPGGLRALLRSLGSGQPRVKHLLLGTNALGDDGAAALGSALERGLTLHTLYLGCNRITSDGAAALARGIKRQSALRALWLKRNPIGEEGLEALLEALTESDLRTLDLTNCALGDHGARHVVETLHRSRAALRFLFLGANGVADPAPLAAWLADPSCQLEGLFLGASQLSDAGAQALFEALSANRSLHALDLTSNGLSSLTALASRLPLSPLRWLALGASPAADKLGVPHNRYGSRDARALLDAAETMQPPPTLGFGPGVARSLRRRAKALASAAVTIPEDVRAIASVYR